MTRKHNPPKGKVPPQLRRYLFKPGHVPWDKNKHFTERNPSRRSRPVRPEPQYPLTEFAAWYAGGQEPLVIYIEDANGNVWHHNRAIAGSGWVREHQSRTEIENQIRAGTWKNRGELITPRIRNPSGRSIHTKKWDDCVKDVKARGGRYDPYAVCTASLGERGSIKAGHRRKNPTRQRYQIFIGETPDTMHYFGTKANYSDAMNAAREYQIEHPYVRTEVRMHPDDKPKRHRNPSGFQLEKTQRLYFMVHAHPHRGGGERLWLTQSGTLSADKGNGARYTSVEVAVARAKAFLKKHRVARKYRFDVCLSD